MLLNVLLSLRAFQKLVFTLIQSYLIDGNKKFIFTFLYHYIASVKFDSVSWEVLVQLIPLHSLHPIEQSRPCFLHVQRFVSQFCLQLHLTIFSKYLVQLVDLSFW